MLIDTVDITVRAGHGGAGCVSFGGNGPDGGNGGRGGDVYLTVTSDFRVLYQFSSKKSVLAGNGVAGASKKLDGKKGADVTVLLPRGTAVIDKDTGETIELDDLEQRVLICKGGLGGRGNLEFKSATNRSPDYAQPGLEGEVKNIKLVLKFIADFGLVGLPNAGKSSLLNELTNAKAAVGAYPFTTLEADLGALQDKVIADIPGLIEGASRGKGLGTKFLKHIEKIKMLLHCISCESENVLTDYETINKELQSYNPILLAKDRLILLTKTDMVEKSKFEEAVKKLKKVKYKIYGVSVHDLDSIENLKKILLQV